MKPSGAKTHACVERFLCRGDGLVDTRECDVRRQGRKRRQLIGDSSRQGDLIGPLTVRRRWSSPERRARSSRSRQDRVPIKITDDRAVFVLHIQPAAIVFHDAGERNVQIGVRRN